MLPLLLLVWLVFFSPATPTVCCHFIAAGFSFTVATGLLLHYFRLLLRPLVVIISYEPLFHCYAYAILLHITIITPYAAAH